jgi:hypothetical protein
LGRTTVRVVAPCRLDASSEHDPRSVMAADNEAAAVVADVPAEPSLETGEGPKTRLCGRCRKVSDWNPDDPIAGEAAWWLCPPCRETLIGGVGRARQS